MAVTTTSNARESLLGRKKTLYVGIGDSVLALDAETGEEIWRTKLGKMASFVTVTLMHGRIYAAISGEIFCLNAITGELFWHNPMKGLGLGLVTFAGEGAENGTLVTSAMQEAMSNSA